MTSQLCSTVRIPSLESVAKQCPLRQGGLVSRCRPIACPGFPGALKGPRSRPCVHVEVARVLGSEGPPEPDAASNPDVQLPGGLHEPQRTVPFKLIALIGLVLLTGVGNRVLYKMALVPLRDHIFFLAQLQNLGYLAVYFTALAWRRSTGQVTTAMMNIDKRPLLAVGACEAAAQLLFMVGAAHIPGALLPVVNQTYLVWSLVFASLILGTRYSWMQLAGAGLVMLGVVCAAVQPGVVAGMLGMGSGAAAAAAAHAAVDLRYVAVCVACFAFPAIANCIKEKVFSSAAQKLGQPLDIFVVNSFGSLAQTFFVLLLLPITTALKGIALSDLPAHLMASSRAFLGEPSAAACAAFGGGADAGGLVGVLARHSTPLLALSYVALNLVFNVAMLNLLRSVGSVTTTLVGSSLVPLTIAAFTLPLPYLEPAVIGPNFLVGASLLMGGLVTYNWQGWMVMLGISPPAPAPAAAPQSAAVSAPATPQLPVQAAKQGEKGSDGDRKNR
ncbi:hypothetical protein CHLRE_01g030300v5 [Chlamydomonas reinhardtii]|uniref:Uncharacterized protein n=1 Tax=Chlamydomonas reinhardtii TaxID=3055 RepID=A0A2K3E6Q7_CHLRE|nr:uncharacterized protein CHLRE_01g030300v5 [Chlamydomonas reinhardtii]PNW88454.1 hypothetical protein CHLRE_01g030300v5 [Chlamydomonas reinhardtii]